MQRPSVFCLLFDHRPAPVNTVLTTRLPNTIQCLAPKRNYISVQHLDKLASQDPLDIIHSHAPIPMDLSKRTCYKKISIIAELKIADPTNKGDLPLIRRTWNQRRFLPNVREISEFVDWANKRNLILKNVHLKEVSHDVVIRRNFLATRQLSVIDQKLLIKHIQPVYKKDSQFFIAIIGFSLFSFQSDACDILYCVSSLSRSSIIKKMKTF